MSVAMTAEERAGLPLVQIEDDWLAGERLLSRTILKRSPKELAVTIWRGRGRTPRTDAFAKLVIRVAERCGGTAPLVFRQPDGNAVMLDWGCVGYLAKHQPPELELVEDRDGYVVGLKPTAALLQRYDETDQTPHAAPYWAGLATRVDREDAGWAQSDESWIRPKSKGTAYLSCAYNSKDGWVRIGLTAAGDSAHDDFSTLLAHRARIERLIGEPLAWNTKADRNERQLFIKLSCDPADPTDWPRQHAWLAERLPMFETLLESTL